MAHYKVVIGTRGVGGGWFRAQVVDGPAWCTGWADAAEGPVSAFRGLRDVVSANIWPHEGTFEFIHAES